MTRRRILVVDDQRLNIELVAGMFEADHEVLFALDGAKALEIAATQAPHVILLDVMMPGMDGYEVFRRLKMERRTRDIPVIFATALVEEEDETRALELGAADYVTKPFRRAIVRARVKNQIDLALAREQLRRQAVTDALTGLANRRCFDEALDLQYARHIRSKEAMSLIMLDVDHFKAFNDAYGHVAGDHCLRRVAGAIQGVAVRTTDLCARYGGEEFVCLLDATDHAGAITVAENMRRAIIELAIPHRASSAATCVTASLGVVTARCAPGQSPQQLLTAADARLYAAKAQGRNCISAAGSGSGGIGIVG